MNRFKIAQYIALVATLISVVGFVLVINNIDAGGLIMFIGFIVGMVSYIFGGLLTAIKMAGGIAKWGWLVVPFPTDIITFIFAFIFALIAFICLPIIPVRKAYKESGAY